MTTTGLQTIILHDSYFRGKRTKIACAGHTNNTGDNGMGKTSALTLIPVFYGYEPERLISRSGSKKSFADYYLPHPQSLIVFEYSRYDGECCVCLYRKNQGGIAYRFITGNADQTIFSEELADLFADKQSISDILKRSLPFETSNQVDTITDYRAIIQNNRKILRRRSKGRQSYLSEASKYALSNTSINHIGALTSVVLKHDRLLAQFKTMLVDSFLRDQISLESKPIDTKGMDLIEDLRSVNSFNIKVDKLTEAYQNTLQLLADWATLSDTYEYSQKYNEAITAQQQQLEIELTQKQELKNKTAEAFNQEIDKMIDLESSTQIELNNYNQRISNLNEQKQAWEAQDIEKKRHLVSNIEEYKQRIEEQTKIYNALQEDAQTIKNEHEKRLRGLSDALTDKIKRLNDKKDQIRDAATVDIKEVEVLINNQSEKDALKLEDIKANNSRAYHTLKETKQPVEIEIAKAKDGSIDAESQLSKDKLKEHLSRAYTELATLDTNQNLAQDHLDKAKEALGQKQGNVDLLNKNLERLQNKAESIHKLLYPAKDSLLETLMQHPEHSKNSIMKVLNPDLLHRQDLAQEWLIGSADNLTTSLYGLDINLAAIDMPDSATESSKLSHQYDAIKQKVRETKTELEQAGKELENARKEVRESSAKVVIIRNKKTDQNKEVEQIEQQQRQLAILIQSRQEQLIAAKETELSVIDTQLDSLLKEQESQFKNFADSSTERLQTYKNKIIDLEKQRDSELENVALSINEAESNKERDEQAYQVRYLEVLADKGVDTNKLAELHEEISQLNHILRKAEGFQKIIIEYQRWYREEWSHFDTYQERAYELQERVDEVAQKTKDHRNLKQIRISEIGIEIKRLTDHQSNVKAQLTNINQWQAQADTIRSYQHEIKQTQVYKRLNQALTSDVRSHQNSEHDILPSPIEPNLRDAISIDANTAEITWLTQAKSSIKKNKEQVFELSISAQTFNQDISHHSGSKIHKYWQSRQSEYYYEKVTAYDVEIEKPITKEVRELLDIISLYQLMSEDLNQLKRSIRSQFDSTGLHFSNYYHTLKKLNSSVKSIGSDLARKINTEHNFPALTDIEIELESKIHTYDMWSDLAEFDTHYQDWKIAGIDVLPNEVFISSFERLLSSLENTQITEDIESLVELKISITENGRVVPIYTDQDLQDASSTGLSLLAVIVVFCGMTRYLCPDENVTIHWPLDEIGKLSNQNTKLLFELMEKRNVSLFCAQPDASPLLNQFFVNKNWLDLKDGVRTIQVIPNNKPNPLLQKLRNIESSNPQV
ncbi:ATP-binding protein [Psychrobacter aquaticus]|nr:ATP-binding protein [Psychrobacter aquaticus]